MATGPKTSIHVVTCNRAPAVLARVLDALHHGTWHPYDLTIVDNASADPTLSVIREYAAMNPVHWRVVSMGRNAGLPAATNAGLARGRLSGAEAMIHLDDDCLIEMPGWNKVLAQAALLDGAGMSAPHRAGERLRRPGGYDAVRWALGFCWAIRPEAYDAAGGYDERLQHQNECDLALRVRLAGWDVAGVPEIAPVHLGEGPRSEMSLLRENFGCVQFRDKWCRYFRGPRWDFGTDPVYLMQHWPPDEAFYDDAAKAAGLEINPSTEHQPSKAVFVRNLGQEYYRYETLRPDQAHKERPGAWAKSRAEYIATWEAKTGERYDPDAWWPRSHLQWGTTAGDPGKVLSFRDGPIEDSKP